MIEVEVKLPLRSLTEVQNGLNALGFTHGKQIREVDQYFDNITSLIRKSGEALRIRQTIDLQSGERTSVITFKGKKLDRVSMTRQELETGVEDADICRKTFAAMGYFPVGPRVVKTRNYMHYYDVNACLDEVEGLGPFLELEILVEEAEETAAAESEESADAKAESAEAESEESATAAAESEKAADATLKDAVREDEDRLREAALARIGEILEKIGYTIGDTVTNSYLSMLMNIKD